MSPFAVRTKIIAVQLLAAALLFHASPARAQERPLLEPIRDASITYTLTGSLQVNAKKMIISYGNHAKKIRMDLYQFSDSTVATGSTLVDLSTKLVTLLLPEQHGYVVQPVSESTNPALFFNYQMNFARLGPDQVAGRACMNWMVTGQGPAATACISSDGILLRAVRAGDKAGSMEATSVTYKPQEETVFEPPADYVKLVKVPLGSGKDQGAAPAAH